MLKPKTEIIMKLFTRKMLVLPNRMKQISEMESYRAPSSIFSLEICCVFDSKCAGLFDYVKLLFYKLLSFSPLDIP